MIQRIVRKALWGLFFCFFWEFFCPYLDIRGTGKFCYAFTDRKDSYCCAASASVWRACKRSPGRFFEKCSTKNGNDYSCGRYGEQKLTTECIENVIMMVPFSAVVLWTFGEQIGNGWKKMLWQSGKIAFIFSISIEMLQLLLRLGTFQLSDIFYNTVGGVLGGLMYCAVMKVRKRL